jgi:hypothetical protein
VNDDLMAQPWVCVVCRTHFRFGEALTCRNCTEHEHEHEHHHEGSYRIQIDRTEYAVHKERMTGEELRHVPPTPIGPDRDLFEVVPGGSDRKISNDEVVEIRSGLRFFIAPAQINPGKGASLWERHRVAAQ